MIDHQVKLETLKTEHNYLKRKRSPVATTQPLETLNRKRLVMDTLMK